MPTETQPNQEPTERIDIVKLVDDTKKLVEENTTLKANNEELSKQIASVQKASIIAVDELVKGDKSEIGERELSKAILEDIAGEEITDYDKQAEVIASKLKERNI